MCGPNQRVQDKRLWGTNGINMVPTRVDPYDLFFDYP